MPLTEALATSAQKTKSILAGVESSVSGAIGGPVRPRTKEADNGISLTRGAIGGRTGRRSRGLRPGVGGRDVGSRSRLCLRYSTGTWAWPIVGRACLSGYRRGSGRGSGMRSCRGGGRNCSETV